VGVLNIYDVMLARNIHAYIAIKNDVCLRWQQVATPGAESAVYDCHVLNVRSLLDSACSCSPPNTDGADRTSLGRLRLNEKK